MDEIVQLIVQKTGISEDQARMAAETVLSYVKAKLPAPLAGQLDSFLDSDLSSVTQQVESMLDNMGGLFGNRQ